MLGSLDLQCEPKLRVVGFFPHFAAGVISALMSNVGGVCVCVCVCGSPPGFPVQHDQGLVGLALALQHASLGVSQLHWQLPRVAGIVLQQ